MKLLSRTWVVVAVATLLYLPALRLPFEPDEYLITGPATGGSPWMGKPWDLYQFSSGAPDAVAARVRDGSFPWYTDTTFKYRLWRPLASVLIWGESHLYASRVGFQVDSLLWYALLVACVASLLRQLFPGTMGALAAWAFALNPLHLEPVVWLSARHVLVAQAFGVAALLVLVRGRSGAATRSALLFALALFSSESGLQVLGFAVAWAALAPPEIRRNRVRSVAVWLGVAALYLLLYRALGRGATGMGYIDPLQSFIPLLMSGLLEFRAATLLGQLVTTLTQPAMPSVALTLLIGGFAVAHARAALPPEEREPLSWLLAGSVLALVPALPGYAEPRMLLLPSLGIAAGVAAIVRVGLRRAEHPATPGWIRLALATWVAGIGALHVGAGVLRIPLALNERVVKTRTRMASLTQPSLGTQGSEDVLVLGCDNWLFGQLGGYVRARAGSPVHSWQQLTESLALRVERTRADQLILTPLAEDVFPLRFFRNTHRYPFQAGERFPALGGEVRVLAVRGNDASRLEVTFASSLETPRWVLARCLGEPEEALARVTLPPVGGMLELRPGPH